MQHPKKIVRTTKFNTHINTHQQTNNITRRVERRSPSHDSQQKQTLNQSKNKSESSLQLSKSSDGSPLIKNLSKLSKKQSFQLTIQQDQIKTLKQLNELKKMQLSPNLRDKLFKLQRYDQNYFKQSEKHLKQALELQVKRFEKIRTLDKQISINIYDTQLLVKCLFNHQTLILDFSKKNQFQFQELKKINQKSQQKFKDISRNSSKQKMNLLLQQQVSPTKKSFVTQKQLPKQLQKAINFAIRALSNRQYPEARIEISTFIQKAKKQNSFEFYTKLLTQMSNMATDLQNIGKNIKISDESNFKITKNIDLSNKYIRQNKWSDLQKLLSKIKETRQSKLQISLSLLLQSIIENNRLKSRQLASKSRQKVQLSPDKAQSLQIQNLKKQINKLKQELSAQRKKSMQISRERSKQISQLSRLKSVQKQRMSLSLKQPVRQIKQITQLEQQKKSLESKARSLQHSKKTQQQKLSMLQKKTTSLQLTLKSKQQQVIQATRKLVQCQKQLNEALTKLQKSQKRKLQRQKSITSQNSDKVQIQELNNLHRDFNQLSKQKQQEEYNYLKIIQQKDQKIKQYELKLQSFDSFAIGDNNQLKLQNEEKDKQLIKIKKQLIDSLQGKNNLGSVLSSKQLPKVQQLSPLDLLANQILQLRAKKHQQTLSQGFNLQFNNIQRQQWRQLSKKFKQYKKKYPKHKFIAYLDQKHKYQFDLTQKLTDYQQKMLAIHNQLYRVKSIVSGYGHTSNQKSKQKQSQQWWNNVELIHVKQKSQFAKLFNDLINQIFKFFTQENINLKINNLKITDNKNTQKAIKQKQIILQQVTKIQTIVKQFILKISQPEKCPSQFFNNSSNLQISFSISTLSSQLSAFMITLTSLVKSFSQLIKFRQLHRNKLLSQQSNTNKSLTEQLSQKERQINELKMKFIEIEKEKKIIEKNLTYKSKQIEDKQDLKQKITILQQTVKKYTYFKEVIEQEQKIIEYFMSNTGLAKSQSTQQKNVQSLSLSRTNNKSTKSLKVQSSQKNKNNQTSDFLSSFKKKYQQNSKVIEYMQKLKSQRDQQRKINQQTNQFISQVQVVINQISQDLNLKEQIDYNNRLSNLSKKSMKIQQLNSYIKKKYPTTQLSRKKISPSESVSLPTNNPDKFLVQGVNNLSQGLIMLNKKMIQINQQNSQLLRKVSSLQLSNEQITRQIKQLQQMQKIFQYIMDNKILISKVQSIPKLTENEASINKNPQIIRQIYLDEIKKKIKLSPYNMIKKSINSPKSPIQEYSLSNFSMKTSQIQQHSNSIIETIFRLFSRVNQVHIQYEDSIMQKFEQSRINLDQNNSLLKQTIQQLNKEIKQLKKEIKQQKQRLKQLQITNKSVLINENNRGNKQQKLNELKQRNKQLQKQKKDTQNNIKKFDIIKKQYDDQKILLDKLITNNNNNHIPTKIINNNNKLSNKFISKQQVNTSRQQVTTSRQQINTSRQQINISKQQLINQIIIDQKKQINSYKKQYPKSRLLTYIQLINKKILSIQNINQSLENQKLSVITLYDQFINKIESNTTDWYKNYQINKLKGNSQLITIIKLFIKQIIQNKKQIQTLSISNLSLSTQNQTYTSQSKQLQTISSSILLFEQVIQLIQKSLQQKFTMNSKQKQQIFTNEFYLKNIFEQQIRKKKNISNNLQSLTMVVSRLLHEISLQSSIRQVKREQQLNIIKLRYKKQRDQLNERIIEINIRNKQIQISNKQLSTQNKLIKQLLKKLQSNVQYLQDTHKSIQNNDKSKQYEILRLKQTIQSYVNKQTKLQLTINKLQKQKKQSQRIIQKNKKQIQKLRQQITDTRQQKNQLNKLIQSLRQKNDSKQNSLQQNEQILINLKTNYSKTQKQLQSIQNKISILLQEKSSLLQDINKLKSQSKKQKITLEKQLANKKLAYQTLQKNYHKINKDYLQLNIKIKHLQSTYKLQVNHQLSIIERLQLQGKQFTFRQKKQKDELNKKIQLLHSQKQQMLQKQELQISRYRQKLLNQDIVRQQSKSNQLNMYTKDIQQINKNYERLIKSNQKQRILQKQKYNKLSIQFQQTIKRLSNEKIQIIKRYEQQLVNQKQFKYKQIKILNEQIYIIKQQQIKNKQILIIKQKQLSQLIIYKHQCNINQVNRINKIKQLEYQLQLLSRKLVDCQKNCIRLTPYQRKTLQYQNILLIHNINISQQYQSNNQSSNQLTNQSNNQSSNQLTNQSNNQSSNQLTNQSNNQSNNQLNNQSNRKLSTSQLQLNTLQTRLKQVQTIKDKNIKLQQRVQKLSIQLQKQISQKQFIRQQSQLNRQDYIKFIAQSKQQIRHLRQQNKIITYQKNIIQNQLSHYKQTIKQYNQKNHLVQQQLRSVKVKYEKQLFIIKDSLQKDIQSHGQIKQKIISQKNNTIHLLENQLYSLKQSYKLLDQINRSKQIQVIQLQSKYKQSQTKSKSQKQKYQIIHNTHKTQLITQNNHLKQQLNKHKFQLQISTKDLLFYKKTIQQKNKQLTNIKFQLQSIQKLSSLEKSNYQTILKQIQQNMLKLQQKIQENSKIQSQQRLFIQNKQSSQIKQVKNQLIFKNNQLQSTINNLKYLENIHQNQQTHIIKLNKINQQLQSKLDQKLKQISKLNKSNLNLDMKIKQMERNSRFQTLQLKAQLDFNIKIKNQLEIKIQTLQKQFQEGKIPFSPSSSIKTDAKQNMSQIIQTIQNQNFMLKKQSQLIKQKNHQLQTHLNHSKSKISDLISSTQQCNHLRLHINSLEEQLNSTKSSCDQLICKNKDIQHSKSLLQSEIHQIHQEFIKVSESSRLESQKYKNSQRVLDHELIEYKSKLENVQQCLKQEKQKNYKYRVEIEKWKQDKIQEQISPKNSSKSSQILESQTYRLRFCNHQLEKKLITQNFELKQLQQNDNNKNSLIEHLQKQLSHLHHQSQHLIYKQQSNVQFINSSNKKLYEILSMIQNQNSSTQIFSIQSQNEFDLLIEISNRIYQIMQQNTSLKNKCHSLQQQINIWKYSTLMDLKQDQTVVFHLQNLLENVIDFAIIHNLIEDANFTEDNFHRRNSIKMTDFFDKTQKKLKDLLLQISKQSKQSQLIERYEWSLSKIKKLLKLYIQEGDQSSLQSLKQISNS